MRAQHALDNRLRHLLTALGECLTPHGGERERARESCDLVTEQPRTEHDVLRVRHRNRRGGAQPFSEPEPAQMFHGPDTGGLRSRPERIRFQPGLDHEYPHASVAEFDGSRQAARTTADNQDVNVESRRVHGRADESTTGVRIEPRRSTSTSTTSPGCRYHGGVRTYPTPSGVPVASTSPGLSVRV